MDFTESLNTFYAQLISVQVKSLVSSISQRIIRELKKMGRDSGMMQSDEDSKLQNIWDEICVQVQNQYSIFWNMYDDFLYDFTFRFMKKYCTDSEIKMIWLQTDSFTDWYYDFCDDEDENHFDNHYQPIVEEDLMDSAVLLVKDEILNIAARYSNIQIKRFIEHGYTM